MKPITSVKSLDTIIRTSDFTVAKDGTGYISQRALERLLHLSSKAVKRRVIDKMPHLKTNESNQLHEESLVFAAHVFASEGNQHAVDLLQKLALAGARAFIYTQAGYNPIPAAQAPQIDPYREVTIPAKWVKSSL